MRILIAYATYSGSTGAVAQTIHDIISKDHTVDLKNVFEMKPEDLTPYDFIIFGSNSWLEKGEEGQMNSGFYELKSTLQPGHLKGKRCAIFALGDSAQYSNTFCSAADRLERMVREFDGEVVCPPLKIDQYYVYPAENGEKITRWAAEVSRFLKQEQSR